MRLPDFFIAGAPKCGTTALHFYLRQHPCVFMPEKKEPHHFCTDLDLPQQDAIRERDAYLSLFAAAPAKAMLGEASASYLYSKVALPRIIQENPAAKILVILRNPVDMAYAYHAQQLINLKEDVSSFPVAWSLQEKRRKGQAVPRYCTDPKLLQYREICSFPAQIRRLFDTVPAGNRMVCLFEDFVHDPPSLYNAILDFLGLPPDGRTSFPRVNANKEYRSKVLNRIVRYPPYPLNHIYPPVKRAFNAAGLRPRLWIERFNARTTRRAPLDAGFRRELEAAFAPDIAELEGLLGRRLDLWRTSSAAAPAPRAPAA